MVAKRRGVGVASPIILVCGLVAIATWATYRFHGSPTTGVDDAQIFLNYSTNLAHGHGFVYNVGGPRVEGVTSLLWTLIAVLPIWVGIKPEIALLVLNVLLAGLVNSAVVIYITRGSRSVPQTPTHDGFYVFLYLLLVMASPAYITWVTITLMDVGLWSGLVTALALLTLWIPEDNPRSSFSIAFAAVIVFLTLTRPEALLVGPCLILIFCSRLSAVGGPAPARKVLIRLLGVFLLTVVSVTLWRLWYFGYPLPNTFYAKVSPSPAYNLQMGKQYLGQYISTSPVVAAGALVSVALTVLGFPGLVRTWFRRREQSPIGPNALPPLVVSAMIVSLLLMLPVLTGGDHFRMFRFLQPGFPLLCLTLVTSLRQCRIHTLWPQAFPNRYSTGALISSGLLVLVIGGFVLKFAPHEDTWFALKDEQPILHEFGIAKNTMTDGEALQRTFAAGGRLPSLGVLTAGGIKRTYSGQVIDLMGLNEPAMGHSPGDRHGTKNHAAFSDQVFWQLKPDIVLPRTISPAEAERPVRMTTWVGGVFRGLFLTPRFEDEYRYAAVRRAVDKDELSVCGFFRQDLLLALEQQPEYTVKRLEVIMDEAAHPTGADESN